MRRQSKQSQRKREPFGGLQLAGDALSMLRLLPPSALLLYYIGAIPFILGLLFFCADMGRSAFADQRSAPMAAGMALLFIWMKSWQTAFTTAIGTELLGQDRHPWSAKRILRMVLLQSTIQPLGFLVLPPALLIGLPFPAAHNTFQNLTILADGRGQSLGETIARAWRLAILWPTQSLVFTWLTSSWLLALSLGMQFGFILFFSHFLQTGESFAIAMMVLFLLVIQQVTMLLCPLGVLLSVNVAALVLIGPWAARHLFGMPWQPETGMQALFNDSFFLTVFGLTFLILDPIVKAGTALRCFRGEAVTTGADIRLAFNRSAQHALRRTAALLVLAGVLFAGTSLAQTEAPQPAVQPVQVEQRDVTTLNHAIDETLASPEYAWRLPKELAEHAAKEKAAADLSWLERIQAAIGKAMERAFRAIGSWLKGFAEWLDDIIDWLFRHKSRDRHMGSPLAWIGTTQGLFLLMALAVLAVLVILLLRLRLARKPKTATTKQVVAAPDLTAHYVSAADLPTNEWLALADQLIAQGELRLAMRALFLGVLAELGQHRLLAIASYKSNRDYRRELHRRAHDRTPLLDDFAHMVSTLEYVWYGNLTTDNQLIADFRHLQETIFDAVQPPPTAAEVPA